MHVNPQHKPPGGWVFPVAAGVKLEGMTRDLLEQAIIDYRMRNGQGPGNARKDIDDHICMKWPHFCHKDYHDVFAPNHTPETQPASVTLSNRVPMWAAVMSQKIPPGGHSLVNQSEADRRALVCQECPRNQKWKTGCQGCHATAEQILTVIRKTNKTRFDDRIYGCEVSGVDLRTMVWMPASVAKPETKDLPYLPDTCWRKGL